jgi:Zn finger protein HypA/HybF involved in hydrogenase expression
MHKKSFALCLAALGFAAVAGAQPPGVTMEMINRQLPLEGAPLEVTVEPVLAKCPSCAAESRFEGFALVCPACGEPGLEVLSGDDILLRGMDLETEGPA